MCHTSNTNHTWILKKKTKRPSVKFLILLLFQKFHVIIGFFYTMQYNSPNENVKTHLKEVIYNAYYFKNGKKKKTLKFYVFGLRMNLFCQDSREKRKTTYVTQKMKSSIVKIFCSITHLSSSARC